MSSCQNHTAQVCWHSDIEHESAIFEQVDTMLEETLNHQTWNRHTKCWTPRKSQPQPHLEVTIAARREDFRQHGHTLRQETQALTVDAMADTGCQGCLAGPQLLARLHLTEADLIPVNLIMHSASGNDLRSRHPENHCINHRPGNETDGLLFPHRIKAVSEPSHVYRPDAAPEQLSTRHSRTRDCHENPDQPNATTG